MPLNSKKASKVLSLDNVWIPILVGLVVPFYLFRKHANLNNFDITQLQNLKIAPLLLSIFFIILRDFAFMSRLRTLTQNHLSWSKCLYIIILWDFASAVTPSVVGGGVVVVYLLYREGIKLGNALAYIMIATIADNCFFMAIAPIGYVGAYLTPMSNTEFMASTMGSGLKALFFVGYLIVTVYTAVIVFSLWGKPKFIKWILVIICSRIKFLRKWRRSAIQHGNDLVLASQSLKVKNKSYWIKIAVFTIIGYLSKYAVLNSLAYMCMNVSLLEHLVIFGNQVVLWVVMLLSPTPGSAGTAEFFFTELYQSIFTNYLFFIEILWRILTYYIHIVVGAIVLTKWLKTRH